MFNSREYEWSDISVVLAGRNVTGLRGVKYSKKQEKELLYGKGNKPQGIQHGNVDYSGEITLTQSEYNALRTACGGEILEASFNLTVAYGNQTTGNAYTVDNLIGCEFTEDNVEWSQGDKFMEKTLPIIFTDLKHL